MITKQDVINQIESEMESFKSAERRVEFIMKDGHRSSVGMGHMAHNLHSAANDMAIAAGKIQALQMILRSL